MQDQNQEGAGGHPGTDDPDTDLLPLALKAIGYARDVEHEQGGADRATSEEDAGTWSIKHIAGTVDAYHASGDRGHSGNNPARQYPPQCRQESEHEGTSEQWHRKRHPALRLNNDQDAGDEPARECGKPAAHYLSTMLAKQKAERDEDNQVLGNG